MHRTTRAVLAFVTVSVGLSYLVQRPTQAYPRFMKKEGLTSCGYCHVKEEGRGARNYRGNFYEAHNNSFAGFDDAAEAKTAGVEVGPHADQKPASLTPPAAAAATPAPPAATPTPETPKATPTAMASPMTKSPQVVAAEAKATAAKAAYKKMPNAKTKAAYVAALKKVLALDPKSAGTKAEMKALGVK